MYINIILLKTETSDGNGNICSNLCLVYLQDRLQLIQLDCIPDHVFAMNYIDHRNIRLVVMIATCYMNVGRFMRGLYWVPLFTAYGVNCPLPTNKKTIMGAFYI